MFFSCKARAIAFAVPPAPKSSTFLTSPKDSIAFKKPGASVLYAITFPFSFMYVFTA